MRGERAPPYGFAPASGSVYNMHADWNLIHVFELFYNIDIANAPRTNYALT